MGWRVKNDGGEHERLLGRTNRIDRKSMGNPSVQVDALYISFFKVRVIVIDHERRVGVGIFSAGFVSLIKDRV